MMSESDVIWFEWDAETGGYAVGHWPRHTSMTKELAIFLWGRTPSVGEFVGYHALVRPTALYRVTEVDSNGTCYLTRVDEFRSNDTYPIHLRRKEPDDHVG